MKNMNIKRIQSGFTLIELMIVVAIVAILVALALPAYQDYTIRAKNAEAIDHGAVAKLSVTESLQANGTMPADSAEAGLANFVATKYADQMANLAGVITVRTTLDTGATACTYTWTPQLDNGPPIVITEWICTSDCQTNHVPANCR